MIELIYLHETAFIFSIEDWKIARREHRIIGQKFGSTQFVPVLPVKLHPEEALLLINKGLAELVSYEESIPSKEENDHLLHDLLESERKAYKVIRREQVLFYMNEIIAGKHKKGILKTKEEILEEEIAQMNVNENNMIWPIMLHRFDKNTKKLIDKAALMQETSQVKYETFKYLWEHNYFITSGSKFGGDFLVYTGDPVLYHADFVVRCLEENETVIPNEIVAFGRVCTSVKKNGVFSSLQNGEIHFITIRWIDQ